MPETIYKLSSNNSDLYYLFINYNPSKNKLVLLHNLLQYYYRYIKDNIAVSGKILFLRC